MEEKLKTEKKAEPDVKDESNKIGSEPKKSSNKKGYLVILLVLIVAIIGIRSYLRSVDDTPKTDAPTAEETPSATTTTTPETESSSETKTATPTTSTNNSTAQKDNEIDLRKDKLISYFIELASTDDSNKTLSLPLVRWTLPEVSVGVAEGQFDETLNSCLNTYISDFNALSSGVKFVRNDTVDLGIPKVKIYYFTEAEYQERWGNEGAGYALEQGLFNDDYSFQRAQIFISQKIKTMSESVQCQMIRHEMTHGLGFWGHSDAYPAGIMGLPKTTYSFPEEDKIIIKMLYNSGIPLGTEASNTRTFFENNFNY